MNKLFNVESQIKPNISTVFINENCYSVNSPYLQSFIFDTWCLLDNGSAMTTYVKRE